jgi:hypothetical protein
MKINIEKSQLMRVSERNESLRIKVGKREVKEIDNFKYLKNVLTRYGYCTKDIKMGIAMVKEAFNRKILLLTRKLDIDLR